MKIWKITSPHNFVLEDLQLNADGDFVKVKVTKAAVSGADFAIYAGKTDASYPIIPCRIAAGLVSEAPENSGLKKGERVLLSPYVLPSDKNSKEIKSRGANVDGYLASYAIVPPSSIFALPEGISDEQAVFAEYIAMGINAITKLGIENQEYLVILGATPFGLLLGQLANYYHIIPIIIDKNEEKLALASGFGISYLINSEKQDPQQKVLEITGGKMSDCTVFEFGSAQTAAQMAFNLTGIGGRVGIVGHNTVYAKVSADLRPLLNRQLSVFGISNGCRELSAAINLLANEVVSVEGLISASLDFDNVPELFAAASEEIDKNMKFLINC